MTQAIPPRLARALQLIDERWWLRHGLFWLASGSFMLWLYLYGLHITPEWRVGLVNTVLHQAYFALLTYALLYGVLPALWQDQGRNRFVARLAAWAVASCVVHYAFRYFVVVPWNRGVSSEYQELHNAFTVCCILPPLFTAAIAASLRVYRQWQQQRLANSQLMRENFQAELQLLKAQIHPHFLFNTLNNLYALTLRQSDEAPDVVRRLAGLLRFVVEQSHTPLVSLRAELNLLRNYLALEQLRYGPRLQLGLEVGELPASGRIAPLLLLPLVENAFKHGSAEQVGHCRIHIRLAAAAGWFTCRITNTKNAEPADSRAGIGLHNVRQRLALLYPQRHRLTVEAGEHTFCVEVALPLQPAARRLSPLARRTARHVRARRSVSLAQPLHV
ncbi:sensor histidine kinase [Hymenobacter properus]|uniref:Histidine kinase n=1 Tax=Hymenobacter properus TaxID=2791026 RepID=A0A931BP92_9BACT|nr:histidine kinase [Hymenobacter properus]MBF9143973.1 histidine kinase [Hymenobacter properus]MBR7722788.1 histidine kinase [Microvirga sp. SRT04]